MVQVKNTYVFFNVKGNEPAFSCWDMMKINILIHFELMETGDETLESCIGGIGCRKSIGDEDQNYLDSTSQISINRINGKGFGGA